MAKIRKFIKGIYQYANLFKISNPTESVGDNEVKQIVPYRGVIQNQGDFITAEDHNEIQKNGVLFVKAEYSENFGTGVDAYVIKNYYNEQNLFDGLKLKFQIPKTNLYAAPVLIIEGLQYNLKIINNNIVENARKGELNKNEIISVIYFDGNFILENSRAGEESYGITRYGITTDTALEGKRLAEIIGLEFGGNIQDAGAKTTGKFYYDKALKYYYECIVNNSLTYNDGSKFRAISNKPILDKVENLFETHQISLRNNIPVGKVFETTIKFPTRPCKVFYNVYTGNTQLVDLNNASQYSSSEIVVNLGVSRNGFLQYSIAKNTSSIDGRHIYVMFVF